MDEEILKPFAKTMQSENIEYNVMLTKMVKITCRCISSGEMMGSTVRLKNLALRFQVDALKIDEAGSIPYYFALQIGSVGRRKRSNPLLKWSVKCD